jgi:hypothetical protein
MTSQKPCCASKKNFHTYEKTDNRYLVNICVDVNLNEQVKISQSCEERFSILTQQVIDNLLDTIDAILDSLQKEAEINTLTDLFEFLQTSTAITSQEKRELLFTALDSLSVPVEVINTILNCLEQLGIIVQVGQ